MEIRTKFDVGDNVCTIYLSVSEGKQEGKFRVDHYDYIVNEIVIRHDITGTDIQYKLLGVNSRILSKEVKERNCFKTFKEAQKECDRRNGK